MFVGHRMVFFRTFSEIFSQTRRTHLPYGRTTFDTTNSGSSKTLNPLSTSFDCQKEKIRQVQLAAESR